jgi:hypothetical protein
VFTRNLVRMVSRDGVQQKPVWMVLQAFGWGDLAKASKPPESWTGRAPSYEEIRFMTFDAIINGAGGVIYWGAPFLPRGDPTWDALKKVAAELNGLMPALTADAVPADHMVRPSNPAVEAAVRRSEGKSWLFLANTTAAPAETALSFQAVKVARLSPVGTAAAHVLAAPFHVRLGPWQAAVFEMSE